MSSTTSKEPLFALVDCNNFFASCERVFNPRLEGRPVIVLSNNDGCVIARSNEAKALGIKMGQPFFEITQLCERYQVAIHSSNFPLYGDMSQRVMQTLTRFSPDIEVYSIDEAFLRFDKIKTDTPQQLAQRIRACISRELGIPVSIGIAPSKTLAKLANLLAKKQHDKDVFEIQSQQLSTLLPQCSVDMLWGIGRRHTDRLRQLQIHNAWQLAQQPEARMRELFNVVMAKMVQELNGHSCLPLESMMPRKNILSSRSFSEPINNLSDLLKAISYFSTKAAAKARAQQSLACGIAVFCRGGFTDRHNDYYCQSFVTPTNDSSVIIQTAKTLAKRCFQSQRRYKKAGIMLQNMIPETQQQGDFFATQTTSTQSLSLLLDEINQRFGRQSAFFAAESGATHLIGKRDFLSRHYTTNIKELPEAN